MVHSPKNHIDLIFLFQICFTNHLRIRYGYYIQNLNKNSEFAIQIANLTNWKTFQTC